MKVSCNRVGGLMIVSDTTVKFGGIEIPKYEGGIFRANRWFGFDAASTGNTGLLIAVFKIGIYFVKRGDES